ncbi:MAG: polysaccharide biosynthesis tyrosine autokinase [Ignavibacteria bacterium]
MENLNQFEEQKNIELRDYLIIFFQNKWTVLSIFLVALFISIFYATAARDIYTAEGSIKISIPKSNPLTGPLFEQFQEFGSDRFIANELEVLKSRSLAEIAAKSIIDTFNSKKNYSDFYIFYKDRKHPDSGLIPFEELIKKLQKVIDIEQKRGLDIIVLKADSPSPYEAALIVNSYINAYYEYNLKVNRTRYTLAREFLEDQRANKANELRDAENAVSDFQQRNNVVVLDEQAKALVEQLSNFESQMKAAEIEAAAKQKALDEFKKQLAEKDKEISRYIEGLSAEPYIKNLQEQIAKFQVQKEVVIAQQNIKNPDNDPNVLQYTKAIEELQNKLNSKLTTLEQNLTAYTPEDLRQLSIDVLKLDLEVQSARAKANQLKDVVKSYEARFNRLPVQSIEYARLERNRLSNEKLYLLIEEKYQEAVISEKSIPSNVQVIDAAIIPIQPSKPNRMLIVIVGLVIGLGLAVGYVVIRKYFDHTIRTPEDVKNRGANVLSWIPDASEFEESFDEEHEIIVISRPDSIPTEAFLSAKMKLQFSKLLDRKIKTVLVTSPTPKDGKTFVCGNLAATFATTNNKVLAIDLDLRKPRLHRIFKVERANGITDYLFKTVNAIEDIIKPTFVNNLDIVTSGTIAPNPAEIVSSEALRKFIEKAKEMYDIVIIDSPPTIAVSDAGVISSFVDATVLVASVNQTRLDLLEESINILKTVGASFVGVILNKFNMTNGYGYYYKYYYYYYGAEGKKRKRKVTE